MCYLNNFTDTDIGTLSILNRTSGLFIEDPPPPPNFIRSLQPFEFCRIKRSGRHLSRIPNLASSAKPTNRITLFVPNICDKKHLRKVKEPSSKSGERWHIASNLEGDSFGCVSCCQRYNILIKKTKLPKSTSFQVLIQRCNEQWSTFFNLSQSR